MENTAILAQMTSKYNRLSFTHDYIFGFADRGTIYAVVTTAKVLPFVLCLDRASRGAGFALRFNPNKAQKEMLKVSGKTFAVCSVEYFDDLVASTRYNRGEIFEKLVTEAFGQEWKKDNLPFTEGGDIEVGGKAYQIKYAKATFCNEASLRNLSK